MTERAKRRARRTDLDLSLLESVLRWALNNNFDMVICV